MKSRSQLTMAGTGFEKYTTTTRRAHSVEVTPADIHDSRVLPWLWHGHERRMWGDSAYAGHGTVLGVYAPTLATSFIVGRPRRSCARPIAGSPACAFGSSIRSA
jgi:hypothetical protein